MVETTENYHRIPVAKKKKDARIRTITISKGIKALYDAKNKVVVTYLFSVKQYSMKEAKDWIKSHKKTKAHLVIIENLSLIKDVRESLKKAKKEAYDRAGELIKK